MLKSKLAPVGPKKSAPKKASPGGIASPVTRLSISNGPKERSVEVRKIDNGFIIRESEYGGRGGYKSTERYSPTAPKIEVPSISKGKK